MIDNFERAWKKYNDRVCERIGWVGAFLVVFGYYLNANYQTSSWIVWICGNLCVAAYSMHKKAYPTMVMSIVITIMNIYGYFSWIKA